MKTTIELPDATFRRAKTAAAARGMSLKAFFTQALEEQLRRKAKDGQAPWMGGFGELAELADENRRVLDAIGQEFETLSPEDLA